MRRLVVLGAGTAGTMAVNKLRRRLDPDQWSITVVDCDETHLYQPGLPFIPFGRYRPQEVLKPRRRFLPGGVDLMVGEIDRVDADAGSVRLVDGREIGYDYLVIATGVTPRPDQTPGTLGPLWRQRIFDFYSFLTDYDEWDETLARDLADRIGIELTDAHLAATRRPGAAGADRRLRWPPVGVPDVGGHDAPRRVRPLRAGRRDHQRRRLHRENRGRPDHLHLTVRR